MKIELDLQYASQSDSIPDSKRIEEWVRRSSPKELDNVEVCIRVVDEDESAELNNQYRNKQGPTNVLSFPYDAPDFINDTEEDDGLPDDYLGDLVICAPVVEHEANEQGKPLLAHWAHMVVHGVLHLRGYDHIENDEAQKMEEMERNILAKLGFSDPYAEY